MMLEPKKLVTTAIATFLILGCLFIAGSLVHHNVEVPKSRPSISSNLDEMEALFCKIHLNHVLTKNGSDSDRFHACSPIVDGVVDERQYELELPDEFVKEHEDHVKDYGQMEDYGVKIPGAVIDEGSASIIYPSNATITSFTLPSRRGRRLVETTGIHSILIVMVRTPDAAPSMSGGKMYNLVFVGAGSLRDQFWKCSFGKLDVRPTALGAIDVSVGVYASSRQYKSIANAAFTAATQYLQNRVYGLSSVLDYADHVMFILPDSGDWMAYGSWPGQTTVYNDIVGTYMTVQGHEIGHNLGLTHGNHIYPLYDFTGMMSGAMGGVNDVERGPQECYNAYHSYLLDWYPGRTTAVNPTYPRKLLMAGVVDFSLTKSGHFVVGSVGNLYFMYNRAKSFNSGVYDCRDNLVVVQDRGSVGTERIACLSLSNPSFQVYDSSTRNTLTIQVCKAYSGSSYQPDLLEVSVGYGGSLCQSSSSNGGGFFAGTQAFEAGGTAALTATAETCNRLQTGSQCTTDTDCCSEQCITSGESFAAFCA